MTSQAVTEQGEAELRILDFKTTWSEFQKPGQTAAERGKAQAVVCGSNTQDLLMKQNPKIVLVNHLLLSSSQCQT